MIYPKMLSDLHVHPHYFKYWSLRWESGLDPYKKNYPAYGTNPWNILKDQASFQSPYFSPDPDKLSYRIGGKLPEQNIRAQSRAALRVSYSQSCPEYMRAADVRLAIVFLSPIERGWFAGSDNTYQKEKFTLVFKIKRAVGMYIATFWKFRHISNVLGKIYDYYYEFMLEYKFYQDEHNRTDSELYLASSLDDIDKCKEVGHVPICILSVESMYVFAIKASSDGVLSQLPDVEILDRLNHLKDSSLVKYPLFMITYCHHFSIGLSGQAKSIPLASAGNQETLLNAGFEGNVSGNLAVLCKILAIPIPDQKYSGYHANLAEAEAKLDTTGIRSGERRILVDTKHMSPRSRRDYYRAIILPYNEQNPTDKIPVIASHTAYSGSFSLNDVIASEGIENNSSIRPVRVPGMPPEMLQNKEAYRSEDICTFLDWSINVCDEDIAMILQSEGMIGLVMDQRVLGHRFHALEDWLLGDMFLTDAEACGFFYSNLLAMVNRAIQMCNQNEFGLNPDNISGVWDMFSLGTDYDGLINPIKNCGTIQEARETLCKGFEMFTNSIRTQGLLDYYHISELKIEIDGVQYQGTDALREKIFGQNVYAFVKKHWPKTIGNN